MKFIKRKWWLILIACLAIFIINNIASDIFISKFQFKSGQYMVLTDSNGREYLNHAHSMWVPIECGTKIGTVKGWEKYSNLWANLMPSGIYAVKNDANLNTLIVKEPLSEFNMYFHRSDVILPEVNSENINRIELINESSPTMYHKTCNKGTTDKEIIYKLINILINSSERSLLQDGSVHSKIILLYSNKLPGNAFEIPVWEMKNKYWMEYKNSDMLIKIDDEIIDKISGCN